MIIGLCGYIGSGKDTCASLLETHHQFQKMAFASSIKDIIALLFGWNREHLEGTSVESREWREQVDPWWTEQLGRAVSPRLMLQIIGTEMFRNCLSPHFWTTVLKRRIQESDARDIVISDCRFPEEVELIRSLGGVVVCVQRQSVPPHQDLAYAHSSEQHIASILPDATIDNSKDLDYLKHQLDTLVQFGR